MLYLDGQHDYVQLFEPIIKNIPFTLEAWTFIYGPGGGRYYQNPIFEQRNLETVINSPVVVFIIDNGEGYTSWTMRDFDHHVSRARQRRHQ